ncbi:MAG: aromatic ring-hydroxylating oxygenase subunit alpha [Alphaproteobacteria bacterium]
MGQVSVTGTLAGFDVDPARSRALPGSYYYDPAVFAREATAIFHATWQYVGHVSMLPRPGSYIVREILDQSVVVARDLKGDLRAFFNVCQHRAHRLLEGEGTLGAVITCPYHAWVYGLDGALRTARGAETGFDTGAFPLAKVRLAEVRLASFLGFLFVNLDGRAEPFEAVAGALHAEVASFSPGAAELTCADRSTYRLKANWKVSVENYDECLHCPNRHPTLVGNALDWSSYRIAVHPYHHSHTSRDRAADLGYGTTTAGAAKPREFGSWLLWPNWCLEAYPGGNLTVFHHVPLGPELMVQQCEWYFPHATPTAKEREVIDFVDVVRKEDIPICESVQRGLHSLGYRRGRFVVDDGRTEISEHAVHDVQLKVLRALGEVA